MLVEYQPLAMVVGKDERQVLAAERGTGFVDDGVVIRAQQHQVVNAVIAANGWLLPAARCSKISKYSSSIAPAARS